MCLNSVTFALVKNGQKAPDLIGGEKCYAANEVIVQFKNDRGEELIRSDTQLRYNIFSKYPLKRYERIFKAPARDSEYRYKYPKTTEWLNRWYKLVFEENKENDIVLPIITELKKLDFIAVTEPNFLHKPDLIPNDPYLNSNEELFFGDLWGLRLIK